MAEKVEAAERQVNQSWEDCHMGLAERRRDPGELGIVRDGAVFKYFLKQSGTVPKRVSA